MKINNIGYLLKEGIRGIFLHGFMSFAAICVTVACLLIVGSFSCLAYNFNIMVEDLNKTNEIVVYVDESLTDADAGHVGTLINKVPNVHNSIPITREEALENFRGDHNDDSSLDGLVPEDFRFRFKVTLKDNALMEKTIDDLMQVEGVVKIKAEAELAEGFSAMQDVLHVASVAVIAVLLLVSLLIISNTVKLAMYDRRDEISIMKMVGATNGFIRLPFLVEGLILGMLGAGIAFGLEWVMYNVLLQKLVELDTLKLLTFVPFDELLVPMVATFSVAGFFVGIVGSWTSIRKFMDV